MSWILMGQIAALIALYVGGIFSVAHIVGKRVDDLNKNMSNRFVSMTSASTLTNDSSTSASTLTSDLSILTSDLRTSTNDLTICVRR